MKVILKRNWFGPDATLHLRDENGVDLPDHFKEFLPSDAEVVDDDYKPPKAKETKPAPNTLKGLSDQKYGTSK